MLQYHFYQTDSAGRFLHGATILLPNDETALAKAREYAAQCNVEVWKDQLRLAVIFCANPVDATVADPSHAISVAETDRRLTA
ncbi:MAG: hypothetical protein JO056_02575 [Alphaproteobacteria bacterium]|nr:hypothetical protein [Alphaproteobacteria bacterium]